MMCQLFCKLCIVSVIYSIFLGRVVTLKKVINAKCLLNYMFEAPMHQICRQVVVPAVYKEWAASTPEVFCM